MNKRSQKPAKITKHTATQMKKMSDKTDYHRLDSMKDSEINYDDIPETDNNFWADARIIDKGPKKAISLRVDEDVLGWFKHQGGRYQKIMNEVLRQYMNAHR